MVCQTSVFQRKSGTLFYHSEYLNATSADNKCIWLDQGRLAILDTEEKLRDAIEMAPRPLCLQSYYMIGLKKTGSDFVWLNGVRNRLALKIRRHDQGQCGWISPVQSKYKYKTSGVVFTGRCDYRLPFLCFKPAFINNATSTSTPSMYNEKNVSEEMSFSAKPDSGYSTSSPSMGLSTSLTEPVQTDC